MKVKIKAYMSKGELSTALKNKGNADKRDVGYDYGTAWFCKESMVDRRGTVEVEIIYNK